MRGPASATSRRLPALRRDPHGTRRVDYRAVFALAAALARQHAHWQLDELPDAAPAPRQAARRPPAAGTGVATEGGESLGRSSEARPVASTAK